VDWIHVALYDSLADCCEYGNEPSGFVKDD